MSIARAALLLIMACTPCAAQSIVSVSDESDTGPLAVVRDTGARQWVPRLVGNSDYHDVLRWIEAGNTVTRSDTRPRRRAALRQAARDVYIQIDALQRWQADPQRPFELADELTEARALFVRIKNEYQAIGP